MLPSNSSCKSGIILLGLALFVPLPSRSSASIIACAGFDQGLVGWGSNTPAQISWGATGGNPGGYARFEDASGDATFIIAPSNFLGDWTNVGVLTYDHRVIDPGDNAVFDDLHQVDISGPGGAASWFGSTSPGPTGWLTISVPIKESLWTITSGSWADLLPNVTFLDNRIELVTNKGGSKPEISGIDNVCLSTVPEPSSSAFVIVVAVSFLYTRTRK